MSTSAYLPDELWLMIVNNLKFDEAEAIVLVNKQLYRVARKHLWTRFGDWGEAVGYAARLSRLDVLKIADYYHLDLHYDFENPLWQASRLGNIDIVTYLLNDEKVQVNTLPFTIPGSTHTGVKAAYAALYAALAKRNEEVALLLLSRGAIPYFAAPWTCVEGGWEERIDYIPDPGDLREFSTALHIAAANNLPKVVDFLLQEKLVSVNQLDWARRTPLIYTIERGGGVSMVKMLINYGAAIEVAVDEIRRPFLKMEWAYERMRGTSTPLSEALWVGRHDLAMILLDAGAKLCDPEPYRYRHIYYCARDWDNDDNAEEFGKQCTLLSRFIEASSAYPHWNREEVMYKAFGQALLYGSPAMVSHILSLGVQPLECVSKYGPRPLDEFLCGPSSMYLKDHGRAIMPSELHKLLPKISALIRAGVGIDYDWSEGRGIGWLKCSSLLHWAMKPYCTKKVRFPILKHLLAEGTAHPNHPTPLARLKANNIEGCLLLASYGATLDMRKFSTEDLIIAGRNLVREWKSDKQEQLLIVKQLEIICNLGVPVKEVAGWTERCMRHKCEAAVLLLFDHGVLTRLDRWPSWLQLAADWGNMAVLKRLLEAGANVGRWWDKVKEDEVHSLHPKTLCTLILSMRRRMKGETGVLVLRD